MNHILLIFSSLGVLHPAQYQKCTEFSVSIFRMKTKSELIYKLQSHVFGARAAMYLLRRVSHEDHECLGYRGSSRLGLGNLMRLCLKAINMKRARDINLPPRGPPFGVICFCSEAPLEKTHLYLQVAMDRKKLPC